MKSVRYSEKIFLGVNINKRLFKGITDGIVFNGGSIQTYSDRITLNVPTGEFGRTTPRTGTVPVHIYFGDSEVRIQYKQKPDEKSEIYKDVIRFIEESTYSKKSVKRQEEVETGIGAVG